MERAIGNLAGMILLVTIIFTPFIAILMMFRKELYKKEKIKVFFKEPIFYISLLTGLTYNILPVGLMGPFIGLGDSFMGRDSSWFAFIVFINAVGLVVLSFRTLTANILLLTGSIFFLISLIYIGRGI